MQKPTPVGFSYLSNVLFQTIYIKDNINNNKSVFFIIRLGPFVTVVHLLL